MITVKERLLSVRLDVSLKRKIEKTEINNNKRLEDRRKEQRLKYIILRVWSLKHDN
jgi:hypothetical protein